MRPLLALLPALLPALLAVASGTPQTSSPTGPSGAEGEFSMPPVLRWMHTLPGQRVPSAMRSEFGRPLPDGPYLWVGSAGIDALVCLRRDDGSVVGTYHAGGPVQSQAVKTGNDIIFSDGAGYTWRYPFGSKTPVWSHYAGAPILSRPLLADNQLFFSTVDSVVYALDAASGDSLWRYANPPDKVRSSELELYGSSPPVLAGDTLLVGFHDGRIVALSRDKGEVLWEKRIGEGRYPDIIGAMVVDDGTLFAGGFSSPFVALDLATQNIRWRLDFGTTSAASIAGNTLYVGGTDGRMRAVDVVTGTLIWEWNSGGSGALTQPQITGAGLLIGSSDGDLWLVGAKDGLTTWRWEPGHLVNGISTAPVVVGREAWVITNGGYLASLVVPEKGHARHDDMSH
jgi:outer membrane protein assembly factor BamB